MTAAVIFDLDGVLLDSEQVWNEAKRELVTERGGCWHEEAPQRMMGMSSPEWSAYLRDELGLEMEPGEISEAVVARLERIYRERLPLLDGAVEAVERLAERWPLGLASSSNREIINLFLELSGLVGQFQFTVSSEEVARGKPNPDVFLEVARRLEVEPPGCVAVEDSTNGIRAARAAEMAVIVLPNPHYPPGDDELAGADARIGSLHELTPGLVEEVQVRRPSSSTRARSRASSGGAQRKPR